MRTRSQQGAEERDWIGYDLAYVDAVGISDGDREEAARVLGHARTAYLWRWPIPESVAGLRRLSSHGVPLGVVSNADGQIEGVLRRSGVCQVGPGAGVEVRCVIDSHVVGVSKPDPRIFDIAAEHFPGIERADIAYVGDSITMDVAGAVAAGLYPLLLDPHDDHPDAPCERIRHLGELIV